MTNVHHSSWSGVWAAALCAFILAASEFMPVSLLTPIAEQFQVSEGLVGQSMSVSGIFAALSSLFIVFLTRDMDRKTVLMALTAFMVISSLMVALSPNIYFFLSARILVGMAVGGYWAMSTAVAMRLVRLSDVPKALAIIGAGNALAITVAAPMGSFLGAIIGWRLAFFALVPFAIITFFWQWVSLPHMKTDKLKPISGTFHLLKKPVVALGILSILVLFSGQFAMFTYMRAFLEAATKVDVDSLTLILLTAGVMGLVGSIFIGWVLRFTTYGILVAIPFSIACIAVLLLWFGHLLWPTVVLFALWGFVATPASIGWATWLSRTLPDDAEKGGGLMVATIQFAVMLGASIGGIFYDLNGYVMTFGFSIVILFVGALLAALTYRYRGHSKAV